MIRWVEVGPMPEAITGLEPGHTYVLESQSETEVIRLRWAVTMPASDEAFVEILPGQWRQAVAETGLDFWVWVDEGVARLAIYEMPER